jgi:twitching motility protein PilT
MPASLASILDLMQARQMDDALLRDGDPVYLRLGGRATPVTRQVLTRANIEALLANAAPLLERFDIDLTTHEPTADGRPYAVILRRRASAPQASAHAAGAREAAATGPRHPSAAGHAATGLRQAGDPKAGYPEAGDPEAERPAEGRPEAGPAPASDLATAADGGDARTGTETAGSRWSRTHHPARRASDRLWAYYGSRPAAIEALERLLRRQVELGAADLHLRVGEPPIVRVAGDLQRLTDEPPFTDEQLSALVTVAMPPRNEEEFRERSDTDFAYEITGLSRFRANAFKDRNGTAAVFRTIAAETVTVEQLGISPAVQQLCSLTKGLVLVTGPTGSGKSTTLCALVDLINRTRDDHVLTIEDPIEFVHRNKRCLITQRQVGVHTQSFKSALRAALREDPDVVLVGELRDLETVAIALETAETGHLVLATLHTATASGTIDRIIDQFPADRQEQIRVMLAESLKGVVSQTLLKRVGGGRTAAREVLLMNTAIANLIREGKTVQIPSAMQTGKRAGMVLLNDALLDLVAAGEVEPLEAYRKAVDKAGLAERLKARGFDVIALQHQRDARAA